MKDALTKSERYALLLYRQGKPKSRALPRQAYADPAESVMFPAERAAREAKRKRK